MFGSRYNGLLRSGWRGHESNIDVSRMQDTEVGRRLNKVLGFIQRGNRSNIYVSRRQEGEVRRRLDKVLDIHTSEAKSVS